VVVTIHFNMSGVALTVVNVNNYHVLSISGIFFRCCA